MLGQRFVKSLLPQSYNFIRFQISDQRCSPPLKIDHAYSKFSLTIAHHTFHTSSKYRDDSVLTLPLQTPLTYIRARLQFLHLTKWDNKISMPEFEAGAVLGVSAVLNHLANSNVDKLVGLLSKSLLKRIKAGEVLALDEPTRCSADIEPGDITKLWVHDVSLQEIVQYRYCDIDVYATAQTHDEDDRSKQTNINIYARFHREYTEGRLPDWIITQFNAQIAQNKIKE